MRLGILADIHEAVGHLREAVRTLRGEGVDLLVTLGDFCAMGERLHETVEVMREAGVVGVWGNHDYGLCGHLAAEDRARYDPGMLDYCATLLPTLEVADCLFCHVEPWLDANRIDHLWYFEDQPDSPERAGRSFRAVSQRVLFMGHLHRWLAVTPQAVLPWQGEAPLRLTPGERHLVVVNALVNGHFALYDTESALLTPYRATVAVG